MRNKNNFTKIIISNLGLNRLKRFAGFFFQIFFFIRHSRVGGNLKKTMQEIPAYAGMTYYQGKSLESYKSHKS